MDTIPKPISQDVALLLCAAIRRENQGKWYTLAGLRCWGCTKFSRGDASKMCVSAREGYRGCSLVNKRYDQLSGGGKQ